MKKLLIVARHEYVSHLRRKGFLFATFGLPALLVAVFAVLVVLLIRSERVSALGYIDHSGLFDGIPERTVLRGTSGPDVPALRYADEEAARRALDAGEIDAYFVVPADYLMTGQVTGYAVRRIPEQGRRRFEQLLVRVLLERIPGDNPRLEQPIAETEVLTLDGRPSNPLVSFMIPFVYGILLLVASFVSSGYLMQSLVEEKENRMMEILATSLPPGRLMGGKILGLGLLGLTQFCVWVGSGLVALLIAGRSLLPITSISIPTGTILLMLALFIPSYLLFAATFSAIGAAVTATQEGQQLSSIVSLLAVSPTWFTALLLDNPNSPLSIGLSLFPYTAPLSLLLRRAVAPVPEWQVALTLLILTGSALGMVWAAGRVMRYGMLRYGKRVGLRELGRALWGA